MKKTYGRLLSSFCSESPLLPDFTSNRYTRPTTTTTPTTATTTTAAATRHRHHHHHHRERATTTTTTTTAAAAVAVWCYSEHRLFPNTDTHTASVVSFFGLRSVCCLKKKSTEQGKKPTTTTTATTSSSIATTTIPPQKTTTTTHRLDAKDEKDYAPKRTELKHHFKSLFLGPSKEN